SLHGLVGGVFGCEIGVALPCPSVVCVDCFPSHRELRLPVVEVKNESAEGQTNDALHWLEGEETQKDNDEGQTQPFRTGEKNACGKKGRSPSDDAQRRNRR